MPIVPVTKKNGAVQVCGDFKVSINPVLKGEQYPLPRIDVLQIYLEGNISPRLTWLRQMEIEEESKVYLTINTHKGLYHFNRLVFGIA